MLFIKYHFKLILVIIVELFKGGASNICLEGNSFKVL